MSIVQRARAANVSTGDGHKPAGKRKRAAGAVETTGELSVRVVTGSIFLADPKQAPLAGDRLFDITIRPIGGGRSRAKVHVKQGATLGPLAYRPGQYRIDVAEHVPGGAFQKYPAGASEAVVHVGKTTHAVVVLANDTLRAVADACAFRIGTLFTAADLSVPAMLLTLQNEFNLTTVCIPWESVQPNPPKATSPLSAPLFAGHDEAALEAALAANGWSTSATRSVIEQALATPGMSVVPTPLSWFTTSQVPAWFGAGVKPSPHAVAEDHLVALMRYVRRLGPVHEYVAVNELEDTADTELWGGIAPRRSSDLAGRLAEMAERYLTLAHGVDASAFLLMNDFSHEFYPPSPGGAKGRLAREIAGLRSVFNRAARFHQTMAAVQKVGALRGRVGAGYQMHFPSLPGYLAAPALYRGALQNGIRRLSRLGAPVHITEMAVTVAPLFEEAIRNSFQDPPSYYLPHTTTVNPAWTAWLAARQALYAKHGYAAVGGGASWRKQAQVFGDIARTYFLEPGCDTLIVWGLTDQPGDEVIDVYGHLFDSAPGGTPGAYPGGAGCPRKPAYYAMLNALIEAGYGRHGPKRVPNWLRRWAP